MAYITTGNSYYFIPAADLQTLVTLGYLNAASEFCYTNPNDSTYVYAPISSVDDPAEMNALLAYYYPDEDDPEMLQAPVFDYMVSGQVPYPFWG